MRLIAVCIMDRVVQWIDRVQLIMIGLTGIWQKGLSSWARRWDIQVKINPTELHDQMDQDHPVLK